MGTTENITGILPVVVASGVALKFTESFLGKPKASKKSKSKTRAGYPSTQYRPW